VRHIPPGMTVVGVPARPIKPRKGTQTASPRGGGFV
jgi:hypothetical protein